MTILFRMMLWINFKKDYIKELESYEKISTKIILSSYLNIKYANKVITVKMRNNQYRNFNPKIK